MAGWYVLFMAGWLLAASAADKAFGLTLELSGAGGGDGRAVSLK